MKILTHWENKMTGILQGLLASIGAAQIPFMYSWGYNGFGQLAQNNRTNRSSPVQVDNEEWANISLGSYYGMAIKADGTLWTWGYAADGCLGLNDLVRRSSPTQVGALTNWSNVSACGTYGGVAVKTDGSLWTWGNNAQGRLGLGDKDTKRSSPTQVGALLTWKQGSGGDIVSGAVKTDNTLWMWGNNGNGDLGINTQGPGIASPVQVSGSWSYINIGASNAHGIKTNGALFGWGSASSGAIGSNSYINFSSPVQITSTTDWASVSRNGGGVAAAIKTDNTLWVWGNNNYGQNGQNNAGGFGSTNRSSPTQLGSADWSQVSCGGSNVAAIKTNKTLWTWGRNNYGSLGQNNTIARSSPVQVGSSNWSKIVANQSGFFMFGIED